MNDMRDRLDFVDALRGFAICGVIVAHAASLAGIGGVARKLSVASGQGVLLFFVVSAFTIFLTLERAMAVERNPIRNFFVKRVMRLVPVYWMGIVLYTIIYGLGSRGWREGPELWHYPLHVTLTNMLHPNTTSSVVPGGWSISCEAFFYLAVPFIFPFVRSVKSAFAFFFLAATGGYLTTLALSRVFFTNGFEPSLLSQFWYRALPAQLGVFAAGILLFRIWQLRDERMKVLANPVANLALLMVSAALLLAATFAVLPVPRQYLFAIGFLALALSLSQIRWRIAVNAITMFIGRVSYSAYIFHFIVLKSVHDLSGGVPMSAPLRFGVLLGVSLPVTIALAVAGFRLVEQPTMRIARGWIRSRERQVPAGGNETELQAAA